MRNSIRFGLFAAAALTALVFAAAALAVYQPKITVSAASGGGTHVVVTSSATDDPTAKFTLYAPIGASATFTAPPGTSLGKVTAHAQAADLGGAVLPLTGDVIVANPADPAIIAASNQCDPVPHAVVLALTLQAAGQVLTVPMFVEAAAGPEAAFASYRLVVCLPPPDIPAGTPGRATFGAKLLDADFAISALSGPASGDQRWRGLWTPYVPQQGKPNATGTVETQSLVQTPSLKASVKVTSKSRKVKGKKVVTNTATVSGTVTAGGQGVAGQQVTVLAGSSPTKLRAIGRVTTRANGSFSLATKLKATTYFQAKATLPNRDLGTAGCTATFSTLGIQCISATVAGADLTSATVRAVPRKR
jgi:hypothetical protein